MTYLARAAVLGALAGCVALGQVGSLPPDTVAANTISARPGAVNYIEGSVSLNGTQLSSRDLRKTFLNPNDRLSTETGKAEILLTPGVFLRMGNNSEVRAATLSLTDTQIELTRGEAMIEATGLVADNHLQVIDRGVITAIRKNGLYRFNADDPPVAAVLSGKAEVTLDERTIDLKKGRELVLADGGKPQKFDTKEGDDLYAWSNVRSEYEAAASYRVAQSASNGTLGYGGFGFGPGLYSSGWYWDNAFNSWAWLPGNGAFFSPFGYGFYSPGLVGYAPVVVGPVYAGGRGFAGGRHHGGDHDGDGHHWHNGMNPPATGTGVTAVVPVRPGGWHGYHGNPGGSPATPGMAVPQPQRGFSGNGTGATHWNGPQNGGHWNGGGSHWSGGGGAAPAGHATTGGGFSGGGHSSSGGGRGK